MTRRSLPRWSDARELLGERPPRRDRITRRLEGLHSIEDVRAAARRRVPHSVFEFVDGAAEQEVSLRRSRAAFDRVEFHPTTMAGVGEVDTTTTVLGRSAALPLVLGPTGFARLSHHDGERAVASAARRAGIPFALTTMSTVPLEEVAAASGDGSRWFQLYLMRDHGLTRELMSRAKASGFDVLVVTVDTPVVGHRLRDLRNGLTIPPRLNARTVADVARRPRWWANLLTTGPLQFATLDGGRPQSHATLINSLFDPTITPADLVAVRDAWGGPLVVKGIQSVSDARLAAELGANGIVVSNHGGRQLDRCPTPLEILPAVAEAVGDDLEVMLDSGVRSGADVAAALAFGARACLVGRPYLYALMAGGERGISRMVDILSDELRRTLHLLGVKSVMDLDGRHAHLRSCDAACSNATPTRIQQREKVGTP